MPDIVTTDKEDRLFAKKTPALLATPKWLFVKLRRLAWRPDGVTDDLQRTASAERLRSQVILKCDNAAGSSAIRTFMFVA